QSILEENAPAVAQKNINLKVLNDLSIPLPPLALQQKFAEKIEAIEKHKQIVNVTIKDLETLLASRMQFWFE
ncbi:MAG: restriction endonuclease subunit S, partial [Bacteroidales bacterium]|nr:restriction endonuclease subunit S [Bacteroidales bacterium]